MRAGWRVARVGEICTFNYGKALPEKARKGGGTPVFGSNGVVGFHDSPITSGKTIVIGRKGSFGEVRYSEVPSWPIDTTYFVDEASTEQDMRWLFYRLGCLGLNQMNKAAAVPGLNREDAYRQELLLPPLPEQRRIAAILDKADALRTKRREALAQLDRLAQSIFLEMFGDPVENPKRYRAVPLLDLVEPERGITYGIVQRGDDCEDGVPVLRIRDLADDEIDVNALKRTSPEISAQYRRTILKGGEVAVSIRGTVGRCCIVPGTIAGGNVSREIALVPLRLTASAVFVLQLLRSSSVQRLIADDVKGVAQSGINLEDLRKLPVIQPPSEDVKRYEARVGVVAKLSSNLRSALASSDQLMATLQHRAFRGEL